MRDLTPQENYDYTQAVITRNAARWRQAFDDALRAQLTKSWNAKEIARIAGEIADAAVVEYETRYSKWDARVSEAAVELEAYRAPRPRPGGGV